MSAHEQDQAQDQQVQDQVVAEVDVASMDDAQIAETLGQGADARGEGGRGAKPETDAPAKEEAPVTVETLQTKLADIEKRLEQTQRERDHAQRVIGKHSEEVKRARDIMEQLRARKAELQQVDPQQLFIDNPQGFAAYMEERANLGPQIQAAERQEQEALLSVQREENAHMLQQVAPDFKEHFEDIATLMGEVGAPAESVKLFKTDPLRFSRPVLVGMYALSRAIKENKDLKTQIEQLKAKPEQLLQKIDETARQRTITGATGGGKTPAAARADLTEADIANMSEAEFAALVKDLNIKI